MDVQIEPVVIPATWDEDSEVGHRFREVVRVRNETIRHGWNGDASHDITPLEAWGTQQNTTDEFQRIFAAVVDGHVVGRAVTWWMRAEAKHIGFVGVLVLPEVRRNGIGSALFRAAEELCLADGRTTLQAWADHFPAEGPIIRPPTGFGSIPARDPGAAFAQHHGFRLEQVERTSALHLSAASDLDVLYSEAEHHARNYSIEVWQGDTAESDRAALAALHQRMSVDAPAAGMEHEEEQWTVERLLRNEQTEKDRGRTMLRAIARHPEAGIVAFTTLVVADPGRPVYQEDTLVHGDHRGHRLGMLVKIANLRQLAAVRPDAKIITWNAEENRPMLRVNEAIGFAPVGYEGAWQRTAR